MAVFRFCVKSVVLSIFCVFDLYICVLLVFLHDDDHPPNTCFTVGVVCAVNSEIEYASLLYPGAYNLPVGTIQWVPLS